MLRRRVTGPLQSFLSGSQVLRAVTPTKAVKQRHAGNQSEGRVPVSGTVAQTGRGAE